MLDLVWDGALAPDALAKALRRAGVALVRSETPAVIGRVVATVGGKSVPPRPAEGRPWLWVSRAPVPSDVAARAVLAGAYAVVSLSSKDAATEIVKRAREMAVAEAPPPETPAFGGTSAASRRVLSQIARAARTSMPVLLTGETGTGKEVCARLIHTWSSRAKRTFVPVNCAAIPNELMEAELFGYAKGAFSGAVQRYEGQLMAAEGGTVFLDEIDDTPLALQVKLLRVLEDKVVSRLGENAPERVDFRIVAATNRDLKTLIAAGDFGADLYERLAILSIRLPPLRERREDLPLLVSHFIDRFYREEPSAGGQREPKASRAASAGVGPREWMKEPHGVGARVSTASTDCLAALSAYPWPGNVRELRNVVFQALVEKRAGDELLLSDLPARVLRPRAVSEGAAELFDRAGLARRIEAGTMNLRAAVESLERAALEEALVQSGGGATRAARLLGEVGRGASTDPGGTVRAMARRLGVGLTRRKKKP